MALNFTNPTSEEPRGALNFSTNEVDPTTGLDIREGNRNTAPLNYIETPQTSLYIQEGSVPAAYERIIGDNYHPEFSRFGIQQQLAANQTVAGQFVNMIDNAVMGEIVGGTLEGTGYLLSPFKKAGQFLDDSESFLGKTLVETGKRLREQSEERSPIYVNPNQNEFAPGHWSWWMKNAPSIASTLSLMIPAAGVAKGASMVGKLLGVSEKIGVNMGKALSAVGQATVSRHMENMMEATGVYEQVYKDSIARGMSDIDAKKKAGIAASRTYRADWAMLGMDVAQYAMLGSKAFKGKSPVTDELGKLIDYETKDIVIPKVVKGLTEVGGEAFEEGWQWIAGEEGKYAAEKAFNPSMKGDFSERLSSYIRDGELMTNMFFGGLGGGVFEAAGDAMENYFSKHDPQVEEVKQWATNLKANMKLEEMAESKGDEYLAKQARDNAKINIGIRAASANMTEQSMKWLDKLASGEATDEELEKLGLDRDTVSSFMKEDIQKTKADIEAASKRYLTNLKEVFSTNTPLSKTLDKVYENRIKDQDGMPKEIYGKMFSALLTNAELSLDRMVSMHNEIKDNIDKVQTRIPNLNELSINKMHRIIRGARLTAFEKQLKYINDKLKNDDLDKVVKQDLKNAKAYVDKQIKQQKMYIKSLEDSYTEEDKIQDMNPETNQPYDIDSVAVEEWQNLESVYARLGSSIAGTQNTIKRYKEGDIIDALNKKDYDYMRDEEGDQDKPYTPELNDVVEWSDDNGIIHYGIVDKYDDKDDENIYVKEVDEELKSIGSKNSILKLKASLSLSIRPSDEEIDIFNIEPISGDGLTPDDEYKMMLENSGMNRALSDLVNSLSTSHINQSMLRGVEIRDHFLNAYLSDPNNDFKETDNYSAAVATYEIDWANDFWEQGDKNRRKFKLKYEKNNAIKEEEKKELSKLLEVDKTNTNNFSINLVDKIPIKVTITMKAKNPSVNQDRIYNKELYVHDSDFWNVKMPMSLMDQGIDPNAWEREQREDTRSTRREIITNLLSGKTVSTTNLSKLGGWFHTTSNYGNIHERLGVKPGSLELYVAFKEAFGRVAVASAPGKIDLIGRPNKLGGVYFKTNKTANKSTVIVRANPSKLSTEHADILFEAIKQRQTTGQGFRSKSKDPRVKNLTTQEVINLLVLFGDRATNPAHPSKNGQMPDYLKEKALYVHHTKEGKTMLHFGSNEINLFDTNSANMEENKNKFIEWATKNKNYRVPIGFKSGTLKGFELNRSFKKSFSIGDLVNDGTKSWAEVLMDYRTGTNKNGDGIYAIMTNIDRVTDPTTGKKIESITESPIVDLNLRSLQIEDIKQPVVDKDKLKKDYLKTLTNKSGNIVVYRGVKKGGEKGTGQFWTSNKKVAEWYAGESGEVKTREISFNLALKHFMGQEGNKGPAEGSDIFSLPVEEPEKSKTGITIEQLKELPAGTTLYYSAAWSKKVILGNILLNTENGVKYIELEKSYKTIPALHNLTSIRLTDNRQEDVDKLINWASASGEVFWDKPEEPSVDIDLNLDDIIIGKEVYGIPLDTKKVGDKELKWLYDKLGKQNVKITDKLLEIAGRTGKYYFGTFQSDCITLFDGAPAPVMYHEAFHRVDLGYLNEVDRHRIYTAARKKYGTPEATDEVIREKLADEFMDYKALGGKPKHRKFFEFIVDLYDFIRSIFTGETRFRGDDINKLFDLIERGQFKYAKIRDENIKALYNKKIGYMVGGVDIPTISNLKTLTDLVKGLSVALIKENNIKDINDIPNLDFNKLWHYINHPAYEGGVDDRGGLIQIFTAIKQREEKKANDKSKSQEERSKAANSALEADTLAKLYRSIVSTEYNPIFQLRIEAALRSYGIVRVNIEDQETDSGISTETERFTKAMYEFNTKDNVLASIKFLIATLPQSPDVNPVTRTINHVNFNEAWQQLLFDLWHLETIDEMIEKLESKNDIYYYQVLANKLREGNDMLRNQFKVSLSKHKHMFINFLFTSKSERLRDQNVTLNTYNFRTSKNDIFSASRIERLSWNQRFFNSDMIDRTKSTPTLNMKRINEVGKQYVAFSESFQKLYDRFGGAIPAADFYKYTADIVPLLQQISVDVDRPTIRYVIEKAARDNGQTINEALKNFIIGDISDMLSYFVKYNNTSEKSRQPLNKILMAHEADQKMYRILSEAKYEVHPDLINMSVLGPGGNEYYVYSQNTYLSDIVKKFSKHPEEVLDLKSKIWHKNSAFLKQLAESESSRANFKLATFSAFIQEGTGDSGKEYVELNRIEDYLVKLHAFENKLIPLPTLADKQSYFFFEGLNAIDFNLEFDDDNNIIFPKEVIDQFYEYAQDEKERIDIATKDINEYLADKDPVTKAEKFRKLVSNYHYTGAGEVSIAKANATKYLVFHSFNSNEKFPEGKFVFERDARDEIQRVLKEALQKEFKHAAKLGILGAEFVEGKGIVPKYVEKIDEGLVKYNYDQYGSMPQAVSNIFARHMVRTMQSGIEFSKLITGDPAFKKMNKKGSIEEDNVKRYSGVLSTGDVTDNESKDFAVSGKYYNVATMLTQKFNLIKMYNENIYKHMYDLQLERTVVDTRMAYYESQINDIIKESNDDSIVNDISKLSIQERIEYIENRFNVKLKDLATMSPGKQADLIKKEFGINLTDMLKGYKEIDTTDGQAWISPSMYRALSVRIGAWGDDKEEAYNILQSNEIIPDELYAKSLNVVLQPLKVISYGLMSDDNLAVPIYDKMSMAVIFRQMGRFGHNKDTRIELMELLDRMEGKGEYADKTPIDMVKIIKVAKTGDRAGFKFYKDIKEGDTSKRYNEVNKEGLKNIEVFQQPFALSRRQLVTDPHDQSSTKAGTQMMKMAFADILKEEAIYNNPFIDEIADKQHITGNDIINILTNCTSALSNAGVERIKKRLGYNEKTGSIDIKLLSKMLKRDSIKSGTAELIADAFKTYTDPDTNEERLYLELDTFPNRRYLFSRMISLLEKEIVDIKLPGNQFIQFSHYGLRVNPDDELKWTDVVEENGGKRVVEMECYVSLNLFKHVIPNYDELTFLEKRKYVLDHADSIMGYRIPTQGQNSVFVMKVKDVYPETIGDVITLPAAFTALTGSDFDIDKVYVMRHNYTVVDGKLHRINFHKDINDVWEERALRYNWVYNIFDRVSSIKVKSKTNEEVGNEILDYGEAKNSETLVKYFNKLASYIDDDMVDPLEKEDLLQVLRVNAGAGILVVNAYNKLKHLVGDKLEDNKKKFMSKYEGVTNPFVFNGKMAIENLLINTFKSVYLSPGHIRQTTTPLGAFKDEVMELAKTIHEFDDDSLVLGLDMYSPSRQGSIKFDYIGGKNGIGPFALNNVHHALSQIAGIKLKHTSEGLLLEDENGYIDLSQINGKDNLSIMSWLSTLIDIHVDVAKDPIVMWLNLNSSTYDIVSLFIRGGFGIDTFKFISQPIIKLYSEYMADSTPNSKIKRFEDREEVEKEVRKVFTERLNLAKAKADETKLASLREYSVKELMDGKELMSNINKQRDLANDIVWLSKQLQYFEKFLILAKTGRSLSNLVRASQIDTKKYDKSITGILEFKNRLNTILQENEFVGLDKMFSFDKDNPSFLGSYFNNMFGFGMDLMSNLSIYSTPVFSKILDDIAASTNIKYSGDKDVMSKVAEETIGAIYAKFFTDPDYIGLTPKTAADVMKYVTNTINNMPSNSDPDYKDLLEHNALIKMLMSAPLDEALVKENLPFDKMLVVPNKDLSDTIDADSLLYSWRDLFNHKNPKIRTLGRMLFYYSFLTSGFKGRMFSFHNFIPPSILHEMTMPSKEDPTKERHISFNDFVLSQRDVMQDPLNAFVYNNVADEVIINNWYDKNFVYRIDNNAIKQSFALIGDRKVDHTTLIVVDDKKLYRGTNLMGHSIHNKYITASVKNALGKYEIQLFKNVGIVQNTVQGNVKTSAIYKLVPKKSFSHSGFVIKEYLQPFSMIESYNVQSIPDGEEANTFSNISYLVKATVIDDYELVAKESTASRNIITGELVQEDTLQLPDLEHLEFTKGKRQIGVHIYPGADGLGFALTNATITNPNKERWPRTNETKSQKQWRDYYLAHPLVFNDKQYADAEEAYQNNKIEGDNEHNAQLMLDILITKLRQYPILIEHIDKKQPNGVEFLIDCTHAPTKGRNFWESTGQNGFIKLLTQAYITVKGIDISTFNKPTPTVPDAPTKRIVSATDKYRRGSAKVDTHTLYIFTDNTDRTSGDTPNVEGWYADKYGKGLSYGTENNPTTAVIRGLDNAYPISTMKWFYKKHNTTIENSRWTDVDIETFSTVIDDEINQIKQIWDSGKYSRIIIPGGDGFFNSKIANISKERTPKLYDYLNSKLSELYNYINGNISKSENTNNEGYIYEQLGNKTISGNVKLSSWGSLKDLTSSFTEAYGRIVHIIATRIKGSDKHFGNPFTHDAAIAARNPKLIKVDTTRKAVESYISWLIGNDYKQIEPERREWIVEQLKSGRLKDKDILYYTELGEPSHATALDYMINKYNWESGETVMQDGGIPIQSTPPVQLSMFGDLENTFPFEEDDTVKFSTNRPAIQKLMEQLNIENWADVTDAQWKQLREEYAHCK